MIGLVVALFGILLDTGSAQAQGPIYPWCAEYWTRTGNHGSCGYYTFQQCLSYVSGLQGMCYRNPNYAELRPAPSRYRRVVR